MTFLNVLYWQFKIPARNCPCYQILSHIMWVVICLWLDEGYFNVDLCTNLVNGMCLWDARYDNSTDGGVYSAVHTIVACVL